MTVNEPVMTARDTDMTVAEAREATDRIRASLQALRDECGDDEDAFAELCRILLAAPDDSTSEQLAERIAQVAERMS